MIPPELPSPPCFCNAALAFLGLADRVVVVVVLVAVVLLCLSRFDRRFLITALLLVATAVDAEAEFDVVLELS